MTTLKKLFCLSLIACSFCFILTGCGNDKKGSTSGNNDNTMVDDAAENVGDAAGDLVEGAGNAVEDVADGVGNAVEDLVGANGFDNYDDAHDYFLDTMSKYHTDAKFEIRDEDRELDDYYEGSKGYKFHLYDTSKNEAGEYFGEFYVDANTGVIYREEGDDRYVEYRGTNTGDTTKDATSGRSVDDGSTSGATTNGTDANGGTATGGNTSGAAGNVAQ